ncbi:unnamed protein product [Durusdinium trenchii]|uniref:Uncharacterized protein n=1 Tax=Durusdinium trenchii TaxID=1381693 RepID=A0ABP0PZ03_9DINO
MRAKQRKRGWVILATAWRVSRLVVSPCRSFCSQKPSQRHGLRPLPAAPNKDHTKGRTHLRQVDALTLARRQLKLALDQQATAQAQVDRAQVQVDMAVEDLRTARETGDEQKVEEAKKEVEEAEEKVKEAEEKVEKAEEKVEKAKTEAKKAEEKLEEKAQQEKVPGFQSLTKLLGRPLFPNAVPLNDRNATYSSASSYILGLDWGPFNGKLALQNKRLQAQLLDREQEVQLIVKKLLERSNNLFGKRASDKAFSPAILVAQAPGAGKSHFLAMLGEEIPMLYDLDGRSQTPIISAFTYNSGMTKDDIENLKTDLALRVLYGAARHMSRTKCEWSDFVEAWKSHFVKAWKSREIDSIDINLAVKILRRWYGDRPVVILADEVGKSKDEALVRQELCRTMDAWGGQVFVMMSALSNYHAAMEMFRGSNRRVDICILTVLSTEAYDLFSAKLRELQQKQEKGIKGDILQYRISLAWGATGGYARAIEYMAEYISNFAQGLKAGVVSRATGHLGTERSLPPMFSKEELESVLEMWERQDCPFLRLDDIVNLMPEATYNGSVLIDSVMKGMQVYLPTVAPWHAASFFTSVWQSHKNLPPRCAKLLDLAGIAYKNKVDAIDSSNVQTMKQTSSYFTEVVAAFAAMFAIVKKYKKLPPVLTQGTARSICDIDLDDSFLQEELATKGKEDADEKLASFLEKAVELSQQKDKEQPFLVIMAPPNCKAVDFLIFCQDQNSFVAVQVKSNTLTEAKAQNTQKAALLQAAKDIRSASDSLQLVAFLAIVGSNYTEMEDLKADTFLLQLEDLVALIPPFLRQLSGLAAGVQSVEGEDA